VKDEQTNSRKIILWHLRGGLFIVIIGFLLHYLYEWSGDSSVIAAVAPVNESVWEHLKLGTWATILFMIPEYRSLRNSTTSYFAAKLGGIVVLNAVILIIFYGYQLFVDESILVLDIGSFVIGAAVGQFTSFHVIRMKLSKIWDRLGMICLAALITAFAVFTWHPPHLEIFKDGNSGTYGIQPTLQSD